MYALIIGADRIDTIRSEIEKFGNEFGIRRMEHWSGRKSGDASRSVPPRTELVVIVCDRANHMMVRNVRAQADRRGIPLVYCRHSATDLRDRLKNIYPSMGTANAA